MLDDYRKGLGDYKGFHRVKIKEERIKHILKYAVLAPSTHNTQPWQFRIKENYCELFINPIKKLPKADPIERDLHISMGCCLENLIIAAKYFGVYKSHKLLPMGRNNLIARVEFGNFNKKHKLRKNKEYLIDELVSRINVRGIFKRKSIDRKILNRVSRINKNKNIKVFFIRDKGERKKLAELTATGLQIAHSDRSFRDEMANWMNSSLVNRKEGMPTYSLRVPFLLSIIFPWLIKYFNMGRKLSKLNYLSMESAPLICVIASKRDNKKVWVETGQLAERLMLEFNSSSVRTSIFIASIEMGDLFKKVQKVLGTNLKPQFMFCAGYMGIRQGFTPRVPLEEQII